MMISSNQRNCKIKNISSATVLIVLALSKYRELFWALSKDSVTSTIAAECSDHCFHPSNYPW